jgi:hypothetical protein
MTPNVNMGIYIEEAKDLLPENLLKRIKEEKETIVKVQIPMHEDHNSVLFDDVAQPFILKIAIENVLLNELNTEMYNLFTKYKQTRPTSAFTLSRSKSKRTEIETPPQQDTLSRYKYVSDNKYVPKMISNTSSPLASIYSASNPIEPSLLAEGGEVKKRKRKVSKKSNRKSKKRPSRRRSKKRTRTRRRK